MPFVSQAQHLCKYCKNPTAKNITKSGRNKGYLRTCGDIKCLTEQYRDPNVSSRKRFKGQAICDLCSNLYITTSNRQKYCTECVNNKSERRIAQRYGLSAAVYNSMNKICPICLYRKAIFVDHCHKTGRVRGKICSHCNTCLNLVENQATLKRALSYLSSPEVPYSIC